MAAAHVYAFIKVKQGLGLRCLAGAAAGGLHGCDGGGAHYGPDRRKIRAHPQRSHPGHYRIHLDGVFVCFCIGLVFLRYLQIRFYPSVVLFRVPTC